jgi:hypothetical protein
MFSRRQTCRGKSQGPSRVASLHRIGHQINGLAHGFLQQRLPSARRCREMERPVCVSEAQARWRHPSCKTAQGGVKRPVGAARRIDLGPRAGSLRHLRSRRRGSLTCCGLRIGLRELPPRAQQIASRLGPPDRRPPRKFTGFIPLHLRRCSLRSWRYRAVDRCSSGQRSNVFRRHDVTLSNRFDQANAPTLVAMLRARIAAAMAIAETS